MPALETSEGSRLRPCGRTPLPSLLDLGHILLIFFFPTCPFRSLCKCWQRRNCGGEKNQYGRLYLFILVLLQRQYNIIPPQPAHYIKAHLASAYTLPSELGGGGVQLKGAVPLSSQPIVSSRGDSSSCNCNSVFGDQYWSLFT